MRRWITVTRPPIRTVAYGEEIPSRQLMHMLPRKDDMIHPKATLPAVGRVMCLRKKIITRTCNCNREGAEWTGMGCRLCIARSSTRFRLHAQHIAHAVRPLFV